MNNLIQNSFMRLVEIELENDRRRIEKKKRNKKRLSLEERGFKLVDGEWKNIKEEE